MVKIKKSHHMVFFFRGGYKVIPKVLEFWQGQTNRLHDRLVFRRQKDGEILDENLSTVVNDGWILERLAP
jgi:pyridoxamine 5'-phosphate oxidase